MDKIQLVEDLKKFLHEAHGLLKYKQRAEDFTRNRKMGFLKVVLFLINLPKRSLSVELSDYFSLLSPGSSDCCTKSGFSKARYKLRHLFFIDWIDELMRLFYEQESKVKRWRGFILLAVDGSKGSLFESEELEQAFGRENNKVMSRLVNVFDVLNKLCVWSVITGVRTSENQVAWEYVNRLNEVSYLDHPLMIYDRLFMGFKFMYLHHIKGINYLARCKTGSRSKLIQDFLSSGKKDSVVKFTATEDGLKQLGKLGFVLSKQAYIEVRLLRVVLASGEIEVLISSLLDQQKYPYKCFGKLYFQRWGVETEFDSWKNKFQLEIFSGHGLEAIKQDFYAHIFVANLLGLLISDCEPELKVKAKTREHDYAINKNVALGMLKNDIVHLFIEPNTLLIWNGLKTKILDHLEPVRKNRQFERPKKVNKQRGKYRHLTNYKRAI